MSLVQNLPIVRRFIDAMKKSRKFPGKKLHQAKTKFCNDYFKTSKKHKNYDNTASIYIPSAIVYCKRMILASRILKMRSNELPQINLERITRPSRYSMVILQDLARALQVLFSLQDLARLFLFCKSPDNNCLYCKVFTRFLQDSCKITIIAICCWTPFF